MIYIPILIILLSYLLGCYSTARVVAKSAKSLNIYRVGTGHPDSENIYSHVSRPLGLMVGAMDAADPQPAENVALATLQVDDGGELPWLRTGSYLGDGSGARTRLALSRPGAANSRAKVAVREWRWGWNRTWTGRPKPRATSRIAATSVGWCP